MDTIQKQTLIEAAVYILNKTDGVTLYKLFKILYFAEKYHLLNWGSRITNETFLAFDYGPVPKNLYGVAKDERNKKAITTQLQKMFDDSICFADEDASNYLLAKRDANKDYLSESDIECLDKSIEENKNCTFNQLKEKSHDSAWQKAFYAKQHGGSDVMDTISIAQAAGANDEMINYIMEQTNNLVLA